MGRRRRSQKIYQHEEPSINLMPLIDVVFVVLVMFIVITPMMNVDRIDLALGAPTIEKSQIDSTVVVQVGADDTYHLNQRLVSLKELSRLLVEAKRAYPQAIPQIMPDKKASFQAYENVRTASKKAGFECIDVNLNPS